MVNKKGFLFSISVIILLMPLIMFISLHKEIPDTKIEDTISRARCDKLHYFVQDITKDMERVISISGRRAATAAINDVIESGESLENYTFNCSSNCAFDCSDFNFNGEGSEAAIAELITCGTLHGENASIMINHTLITWVDKIINKSDEMNFNTSLKPINMEIAMKDAWSVASLPVFRITIRDNGGKCFYEGVINNIVSNASIIGLIDPIYPLKTYQQIKHYKFKECPIEFTRFEVVGESLTQTGNGNFTGTPTLDSELTPDVVTYCQNKPQPELENEIFVFDQTAALDCDSNPALKQCFNESSTHHFGGVIAFDGLNNCDPSIPYIMDTGDIENISNETCAYIKNEESTCEIHQVLSGVESNNFNTTCYQVSDIEENYNTYSTEDYSNGPSFLDRLEGNLNLSERYLQKTKRIFNRTDIGLETIVSPFEIMRYFTSTDPRLSIMLKENASWIDYLYWQNVSGCPVMGGCGIGVVGFERYFKLDNAHALKYKVDTSCASLGCCPARMGLSACKTCDIGENCNITYNLTSFDVVGNLLNLTSVPEINISGTITLNKTMDKIPAETGEYNISITGLKETYYVKAIAFTSDAGCPLVTNSTPQTRVSEISSC